MRVAIVEDEEHIRKEFRQYLEKYSKENDIPFTITEFTDGDGITAKYKPDFDIILMDIEMPFVDGMEAAAEIREKDSEVSIIFMTNAPQYAIKGYKVGALDYILKPVTYYAFCDSIKRAIAKQKLRSANEEFITVNVKGGARKLEIGSILYAEVIDHDLFFHTISETVQTRGTIREVEKELEPYHFFKCNKGCIINLAFVDGYQKNDVTVGDTVISVSRARKKLLMEAIHEYLDGMT